LIVLVWGDADIALTAARISGLTPKEAEASGETSFSTRTLIVGVALGREDVRFAPSYWEIFAFGFCAAGK
jgi:hypothetical protein